MNQVKKGLPFLLVLLLPLYFTFQTASDVVSAKSTFGFSKEWACQLNEGKNCYFLQQVFAKITRVEIVQQNNHRKIKVLRQSEWEYYPESSELCLKEQLDSEKYQVMVEGKFQFPLTFKLKDVELDTVTVLLDSGLATENVDYLVDRQRETLQFTEKTFHNSEIKYCILARRKTVGLYRVEHQLKFQPLALPEIKKRIGYFNFWNLKVDSKGNPGLETIKINSEFSGFMGFSETCEQSDQELGRQMGLPVSFPLRIGKYRLKFKALYSQFNPCFRRSVFATYIVPDGTQNKLVIWIKNADLPKLKTIDDSEQMERVFAQFSQNGTKVTCSQGFILKDQGVYYFEKPLIIKGYFASLVRDSSRYILNLEDEANRVTELDFEQLVKNYIQQALKK